jgi:hypothetical protein
MLRLPLLEKVEAPARLAKEAPAFVWNQLLVMMLVMMLLLRGALLPLLEGV